MRNLLSNSIKVCVFVLSVLFSGQASAQSNSQFVCSDTTRCTSKDLSIVKVFTDAPPCATCGAGNQVTYTLKMTIHNGTKSTRTSFALYGTLSAGATITPTGGTPISGNIFVCVGAITVKSSDQTPDGLGNQTFTVGTITFSCGQNLTLTNNYLAWTDASGTTTDRCNTFSQAKVCADIAPKCGTAASITIVQPLSAPSSQTASCSNSATGSVTVTPVGGTSPYNITIGGTLYSNVTTATKSPLAAGSVNFSVTDHAGCTISGSQTVSSVFCCTPPTLGTNPSSATRCAGTSATFTATANGGDPAPTVQWQVSTDGGTTWTNLTNVSPYSGVITATLNSGVTTATLTVNPTATNLSGNKYRAVFTSGDCTAVNSTGATLVVNAVPGAPGVSVVNNCDGSSDLTATGFTGSLLWSNNATTTSIHVTNAATYTVTQTVNGCTSGSGSGTSAPRTTPGAPGVTVVNNCDGSSDLTATGFTGSLLWSNNATTTSIHVTNAATYTVTQTVNGCTSAAGSGTSAPKTTPGTPDVTYVAPLCYQTTFSLIIGSAAHPIEAGASYSVRNTGGTLIAGTTPGNPHVPSAAEVTAKQFTWTGIPAGSGYDVAVIRDGCAPANDAALCGPPGVNQRVSSTSEIVESQTTSVKAYPNPFSDRVKFLVTSSTSGRGSLEVYNMMGQKVKTVYQGFISKGAQTFELSLPAQQISNLVYVLRVGDKKMSGKLLQINQ
jgi:hypothetical protein